MYRLVISLLLILATVTVQAEVVRVKDFLGLNTRVGELSLKDQHCTQAYNVDWSREVGQISKRFGWDSVATVSGKDSIVSIYAAQFRDGNRRLFVVCDRTDSAFGSIYVTAEGSDDISSLTRVQNYWSIQQPTTFAMYADRVYAANGLQLPVMIRDATTATSFPLTAPGTPTIVPIYEAGWNTNYVITGEVRYMFRLWTYTTDSGQVGHDAGYVTQPVKVDGGRILLTDFPYIPIDSLLDDASMDSIGITIYRIDNPGYLDEVDTAYAIATLHTSSNALGDTVYIDSLKDYTAGAKYLTIDEDYQGRDNAGQIERRYGAPGYWASVDIQSYDSVGGDSLGVAGVYYGIPIQPDTIGVMYHVTYVDSATGVSSDTGRGLAIYVDADSTSGNAKPKGYRVILPPVPNYGDGIRRHLYRSHILYLTRDTSIWVGWLKPGWNEGFGFGYKTTRDQPSNVRVYEQVEIKGKNYTVVPDPDGYWSKIYLNSVLGDSIIVGPPYLVASIDPDSSGYTDTIRYDTLVLGGSIYQSAGAPSLLANIYTFNGRIHGDVDSRHFYSSLDTIFNFGLFDITAVNRDDGDVITATWPVRTTLRIMKNESNYNALGGIGSPEIVGRWGCIASESHAAGLDGHYYLSSRGVILETEGAYLERTVQTGLISSPLDNFDKLSIEDKRSAYGFYLPNSDQYLLSIGDSTYVYHGLASKHFNEPVWSVWTFPIGGACLYRTGSNVDFVPGDTMYFFQPGDSTLFKFGTSETDAGSPITFQWYSAPILESFHEKEVTSIGLWTDGNSGDSIRVRLYDEEGTVLTSGDVTFNDLGQRYTRKHFGAGDSRFYKILFNNKDSWSATSIEAIEVFYNITGHGTIE